MSRPTQIFRITAAGAAAALSLAASGAVAGAVSAPGVDRGADIANARCAACHAVDASGPSPNPSAPAFGELRLRYNTIALERKLTRIRRQGHFAMPPQALEQGDAQDLVAYISSLAPKSASR